MLPKQKLGFGLLGVAGSGSVPFLVFLLNSKVLIINLIIQQIILGKILIHDIYYFIDKNPWFLVEL